MQISVNGVPVPESAVFAEMQNHPAADREQAQACAARALVIRELLRQEADRHAIAADPEADRDPEEIRIDRLLGQALNIADPDEAACQRYYRENPDRFRSLALYEASHILIVPAPDEPVKRARDKARALAASIIAALQADPTRFAELAAAHSACPSKDQGGSLGQVSGGDTVAEFDAALARMEEREISREPVETRYGFHIIRVDRHLPGELLPFSHVQERIGQYLAESAYRKAVAAYLAGLIAAADIQGIELGAADGQSPVQ
jgi:peptidyl-prolyl cis-trans isomerase C